MKHERTPSGCFIRFGVVSTRGSDRSNLDMKPLQMEAWAMRRYGSTRFVVMKYPVLFMIMLVAIASGDAAEEQEPAVVRLPRPSGIFYFEEACFEEAETGKSAILSNAPTSQLKEWKNPYMGFCIHIHEDESITVYNHLKAPEEDKKAPTKKSVAEVRTMADAIPQEGNPAGILITSDLPLKNSKIIRDVLNALFMSSIQLFYARGSEPDDATADELATDAATGELVTVVLPSGTAADLLYFYEGISGKKLDASPEVRTLETLITVFFLQKTQRGSASTHRGGFCRTGRR